MSLFDPATAFSRYGGYDLRRGDSDSTRRYGGQIRTSPDPLPAPGEVPYVQQLQRDLRDLGFSLVGEPDGAFGRRTEWAVREFQIYAGMPRVARELPMSSARYLDRLEGVDNPAPYTGPVSGRVNVNTRLALGLWLAERLRCPVVVEAWAVKNGRRDTLKAQNLWLPKEITDKTLRVFARDFTGYFESLGAVLPTDLEGMIALGRFQPFTTFGGPVTLPPRETWPSAEIVPDSLVGISFPDIQQDLRSLSTFKVVRAVSEIECLGFFDSVNAYDNAFVSLGPCHWILGDGQANGTVGEGELGAFLAYYRGREAAEARALLDRFGMIPDASWPDGNNGSALFVSSQRKYTAWVSVQNEAGQFAPLPQRVEEADYFRTWHWFYRIAMGARSLPRLRRRMWDMARIRLRDLLETAWGPGVANVPDGGGTRPARIGDLYSSEAAAALLLRWHIRKPAHVVSGGQPGANLRAAFANAAIPSNAGPPSSWSRALQDRLVDGLVRRVRDLNSTELTGQFGQLLQWPASWGSNPREFQLSPLIGPLGRDPRSFQLNAAGLPPRPF